MTVEPLIAGFEGGRRVLIAGCYGTGNAGDEAILAGLVKRLAGAASVVAISRAPRATERMHGIEAVSPTGAPAALRRADALLVGGGGLFSSHVGRFASTIPAFGLAAQAMRKDVALYGVSVDRTTPRSIRPLLARMARRASSVTVRDAGSAELLAEWGIEASVAPDVSASVCPAPFSESARLIEAAGLDPSRPIAGLCLTAVEPEFDASLLEAIPALIREMPGLQFCFLPMSQHPGVQRHNDLALGRRLQARTPELAIVEGEHHPEQVISLFGHFAAAVCMRYHSLLFAHRMGARVLGVPYAEKCRTWLREHELPPVAMDVRALRAELEQALFESGESQAFRSLERI